MKQDEWSGNNQRPENFGRKKGETRREAGTRHLLKDERRHQWKGARRHPTHAHAIGSLVWMCGSKDWSGVVSVRHLRGEKRH
jgi:hypothetical protein